ncbi:hypothetical protein R5R35_002466 [Gryllus longicercus]|uniref:Uncharacterized protein n=1 Tax=Gryllus longicercus TaxID=2509291 RepID=A0AAN9Z1Z0_9ORTH
MYSGRNKEKKKERKYGAGRSRCHISAARRDTPLPASSRVASRRRPPSLNIRFRWPPGRPRRQTSGRTSPRPLAQQVPRVAHSGSARVWLLDFECRVMDVECRVVDVECRMMDGR